MADVSKRNAWLLRLADFLGRGLGRFRWLDRLGGAYPVPVTPADLRDWTTSRLAAVWLGHASVLLRVGLSPAPGQPRTQGAYPGVTILTDPVFSPRVGLGLGLLTAGPRRLAPLPLALSALPPIDVLLISHAHFDHLDRPTLHRLSRGPARGAVVITSEHNSDLLADLTGPRGFSRVVELRHWQSCDLPETPGLRVTALPVKHWGARVFYDDHRGSCAFLLDAQADDRSDDRSRRVLFGADSADQRLWTPIADSGGVDLCCVGIGAYDPWVANHATPEQAAAMARDAGARCVLPMHHSTFKLSREPIDEPLSRFLAAWTGPIACRQIGELWRAQ